MSKRKILSLAMALSIVAILAAGATLAYFTDTASITNTFTVGNVSIDLIESQYHRVNAGKGYTTEAEPLSGGYLWASNVQLEGTKENTPDAENYSWTGSFFSDAQIQADAANYKDGYFKSHATNMVPGSNVRKNPYVINTSTVNDAYIRVNVYVPKSLFTVLDNGLSYWTTSALEDGVTSKAVELYNAGNTSAIPVVTKNSVDYYKFDFVYEKPLAPGEMTFWNVWGNIAIDPDATSTDLNGVSSFDVIFEADAIQADGFANAAAAFEAFDKEVTK